MVKQFFLERIPHNAMKYDDFVNESIQRIQTVNFDLLDDVEKKNIETTKLNHHRSKRIDKTYKISGDLRELISEIHNPQLWMVITEDWCGDSAQNLPHIAKIAELNDMIALRIIERDKHPEIMDQYLTNGTRSIPILIAFDEEGNELFKWGPRPVKIQKMVNKWKEEGLPKSEWLEKLHLEYGRNRGKFFEEEFNKVIKNYLIEKNIESERVLC